MSNFLMSKRCRESHPEMLVTCFGALVWEQANCCQNLHVGLRMTFRKEDEEKKNRGTAS